MTILSYKPNRPEDALEKLTPMIAKLAHKYCRHNNADFDDVFQFGCVGLMEAYNNFDATKGRAFSSHAYQWIQANIRSISTNYYYRHSAHSSFKAIEDCDRAIETDLDANIDYQNKIKKMDPTTKAIAAARLAGFSYREIAEQLTKLGQPHTLHQCRNKYEAAINDSL